MNRCEICKAYSYYKHGILTLACNNPEECLRKKEEKEKRWISAPIWLRKAWI